MAAFLDTLPDEAFVRIIAAAPVAQLIQCTQAAHAIVVGIIHAAD